MRKIKVKKKPQPSTPKNIEGIFTHRVKIFAIIIAVLIVISAVFIYLENTDSKIVIKNGTDMKLEYVKAYYVGSDDQINDGINQTDIAAGSNVSVAQDPINLLGYNANLEIRFKFENHEEMFVDAGIFNDNFNGKITIAFSNIEDGKVKLYVKAKSGVISSNLINCDDTFTINLNENSIED